MKLALIRDDIVENVIVPPEGEWEAPEGVVLVECPDDAFVGPGFTYDGETFSEPAAPVPDAVSMRQARLALISVGKLGDVDDVIAELPSPQREAAQIEWEYATEVARNSPLVAILIGRLGMTDEQANDLFRLAASM